MITLLNKKILIAGASSGIGKSTAIILDELGASLILTSRNSCQLEETLSILKGDSHRSFVCDYTKESDRKTLIGQIPQLDGFVYSIGVHSLLPIKFIDESEIERNFNPGFNAAVLFMSLLLKNKKFNTHSSIVFVSSVLAKYSKTGCSMYSATKAALDAYVRTLAIEIAAKKIRANIVSPGFIHGEMLDKTIEIAGNEYVKTLEAFHPLGFGYPKDVAHSISFLLSDKASWITGTVLQMGVV